LKGGWQGSLAGGRHVKLIYSEKTKRKRKRMSGEKGGGKKKLRQLRRVHFGWGTRRAN